MEGEARRRASTESMAATESDAGTAERERERERSQANGRERAHKCRLVPAATLNPAQPLPCPALPCPALQSSAHRALVQGLYIYRIALGLPLLPPVSGLDRAATERGGREARYSLAFVLEEIKEHHVGADRGSVALSGSQHVGQVGLLAVRLVYSFQRTQLSTTNIAFSNCIQAQSTNCVRNAANSAT